MFEKKKLAINCDVCDTRTMDENVYAKYEDILINADVILVNERSKALLASMPVTCNVDETIEIPNEEKVNVMSINGGYEIGPNTMVSPNTLLCVNGSIDILPGAGDVLKDFLKITVNGRIRCPKSLEAYMDKISINGGIEVYPDDCVILDENFVLDKYFPLRAKQNGRYYAKHKVILSDDTVNVTPLVEKNVQFLTKTFVTSESQLEKCISLFDESAQFVIAPADCRIICENVTLNEVLLNKYGNRLFICGDIIMDDSSSASLDVLEKLIVKGNIRILYKLMDKLKKVDPEYDSIIIEKGRKIVNKLNVTIDNALLRYSPDGIHVMNAVNVTFKKEVSPADIIDLVKLENCAHVKCSEEQKSAVDLIGVNIAIVSGGKEEKTEKKGIMDTLSSVGDIVGLLKDTKLINADKHVL